ncbi:hypothetical protein GWI33_007641 [Rhynchophorus ferrugineus]|uniref:Uncharacterized protein n=1 Tax=Rhynchophorus ferrugineus TaxID=354439 RepID=A0A834IIH0_RHYFE|nr:hypothetical protein GWI33_007641 [Rhynchophorus ferrugineus]
MTYKTNMVTISACPHTHEHQRPLPALLWRRNAEIINWFGSLASVPPAPVRKPIPERDCDSVSEDLSAGYMPEGEKKNCYQIKAFPSVYRRGEKNTKTLSFDVVVPTAL